MKMLTSNPQLRIALILILICIPSLWGILQPDYFSAHDDMHPAWIYQMSRAMTSGQFPPRWAPDLSYGYGYPLFHFIYPLPYYIGAIFLGLGLSYTDAVQAVHGIAIIASVIAMYAFLRNRFSQYAALLGATLYLYTPYRAVNTYVRGALGEAFAVVWIPLILLGIDLQLKSTNRKYLALTSCAIAGLMLTHNIAAMIFIPLTFLYTLIQVIIIKPSRPRVIRLCLAWFLGLSLSAYFWVPAFAHKSLMVDNPIFNYTDHFPFLSQLIKPSWGYGASLWGPYDGLSFQIGIINLLVFSAAGLLVLLKLKSKNILFFPSFFLGASLIGLYLLNIRSSWFWEAIPLMNYFQFPWRLLIILVLTSSVLAGWVGEYINQYQGKAKYLILLLPLVFTYTYFTPNDPRPITNADIVHRFFAVDPEDPAPPISEEYQTLQEEYLRLPKATQVRPDEYPFDRFHLDSPLNTIDTISQSPTFYHLSISSTGPSILSAAIYKFPGWHATVNGQQVDITAGQPHGQITFPLPDGTSEVTIYYQQTGITLVMNLISLISLITVLALCIPSKSK